jgi:hypothetical protein
MENIPQTWYKEYIDAMDVNPEGYVSLIIRDIKSIAPSFSLISSCKSLFDHVRNGRDAVQLTNKSLSEVITMTRHERNIVVAVNYTLKTPTFYDFIYKDQPIQDEQISKGRPIQYKLED